MPKPSGEPFQDMCTMIGLMTLTWAWAENTLAIVIGVINEHAGPVKGHAEPPLMLKGRVACLKAMMRDIGELESLKNEGRALALRFTQLGARRNDFIHGAAWQLDEGRFQAVSIVVIAGQNEIRDHSFNQADAVGLTAEIAKLQDDAASFLARVLAIFS